MHWPSVSPNHQLDIVFMLETDKWPLFPQGLEGKARVVEESVNKIAMAKHQENFKAKYLKRAHVF